MIVVSSHEEGKVSACPEPRPLPSTFTVPEGLCWSALHDCLKRTKQKPFNNQVKKLPVSPQLWQFLSVAG